MKMDQLKAINNAEQYENALDHLAMLMDQHPAPNTSESDYLEVLSILIEKYESQNFEIELPERRHQAEIERLRTVGKEYRDRMREQTKRAKQAEKQRDQLQAAIDNFLAGDYPHPRAYRPDSCPHGKYYYEECPECDAAYLGQFATKPEDK